MGLNEYTFFLDEKVTVWERSRYDVEAKSYKEALEKMKQELEDPTFDPENGFVETDIMYDTKEHMTPEENDNQSTREIVYKNKIVLTNEKLD